MLINKCPLLVNRDLANVLGLNEALVLQQLDYWLEKNKKNNRNFHKGRYWTYNTLEEWQEEFSFWSLNTVKRIFKRLREMELIIVDNFNSYQMDRTLWYSIDYERLREFTGSEDNNETIISDCNNGENQNEEMEEPKLAPPIPEISTENSSEMLNKSINHGVKYPQKIDGLIDNNYSFLEEYKRIMNRCELFTVDESYHDAVTQAIRILLLEIEGKKRIKVGDNYIPSQLIKEDLEKLDSFVINHAIFKFQEASYGNKIRNSIAYLKSCIINSINELKIDIDSDLRTCGLI